nr:Gag-Pol polyprotein [Tanacetum cinerariifolium]
MTLETHNWSSSAHQELHKIVKDEIFPIVNQVDARVQNFEIQFLKEAAKFVGDFKSLTKEADESLAKHKVLELEIEHLLRAVVSQDIISIVQNNYVDETSNLQTELEQKKRLKSDFKIREDELIDKQIQLEKKIKEVDNILVKMGQSIQTIHMLPPKPDSFYHTEQKMALGYQNPFYLKQAQQKQQSLYDGKVLFEKHDPPVVHDSEETLQLAQERTKFVEDFKYLAKEADESLAKHKALELEIEHLLRAVVSQDIIFVVQNNSVGETSNIQTELERSKLS